MTHKLIHIFASSLLTLYLHARLKAVLIDIVALSLRQMTACNPMAAVSLSSFFLPLLALVLVSASSSNVIFSSKTH